MDDFLNFEQEKHFYLYQYNSKDPFYKNYTICNVKEIIEPKMGKHNLLGFGSIEKWENYIHSIEKVPENISQNLRSESIEHRHSSEENKDLEDFEFDIDLSGIPNPIQILEIKDEYLPSLNEDLPLKDASTKIQDIASELPASSEIKEELPSLSEEVTTLIGKLEPEPSTSQEVEKDSKEATTQTSTSQKSMTILYVKNLGKTLEIPSCIQIKKVQSEESTSKLIQIPDFEESETEKIEIQEESDCEIVENDNLETNINSGNREPLVNSSENHEDLLNRLYNNSEVKPQKVLKRVRNEVFFTSKELPEKKAEEKKAKIVDKDSIKILAETILNKITSKKGENKRYNLRKSIPKKDQQVLVELPVQRMSKLKKDHNIVMFKNIFELIPFVDFLQKTYKTWYDNPYTTNVYVQHLTSKYNFYNQRRKLKPHFIYMKYKIILQHFRTKSMFYNELKKTRNFIFEKFQSIFVQQKSDLQKLDCPICDTEHKNFHQLRLCVINHLQNQNCCFCNKNFELNNNLCNHIFETHRNVFVEDMEDFKCCVCHQIYNDESTYLNHIETHCFL